MTSGRGSESRKATGAKRPFIGVHFKCCGVYARIYINRRGDAFVGWCPKCGHKVEAIISEDGEEGDFFVAS